MRLLGHQRAFMEAAEDQLQLAGIGVYVTDRKNPGHARFESRRLHGTRLFSRAMPQFATGPSFIVSPKNGSIVSQATFEMLLSVAFTVAPESRPPSPSS